MTEADHERRVKRIESALKQASARLLEEGCDSVRIVCTYRVGGVNWGMITHGDGNLYAQKASVEEWLEKVRQFTRTHADMIQREEMGEGDD